jgi:hypothetical protein
MTTSTHADAPRGIGFLYSLNRFERRDFAGKGVEHFGVFATAV